MGRCFEGHEVTIDRSNLKFKATENMKMLLEEGRKGRKGGTEAFDDSEVPRKEKKEKSGDTEELTKLVESMK